MNSGVAVRKRTSRLAALTRSYILADLCIGRDNNISLLRFLAASLVIVSHCAPLAWGQNLEFIGVHTDHQESAGSFGILTFFAISGFLVVQSFVSRGRLRNFAAARALRIYPGLVGAVIYSVVLASFATDWPLGLFLRNPQTQRYLIHNSLAYPIEYTLPGAFAHNPFPGSVNGSLWTLPLEIQMYILVAVFGLIGIFKAKEIYNGVFAVIVILMASVKADDLPLVVRHPDAPRLALAFLCGAFLFMNRDRIRISIPWALFFVALITWGIGWGRTSIPNLRIVYIPALAYIIFVLGYHPKLYFTPFNRLGDYSYGLYIYAFPTQQLISFRYPGIGQYELLGLAYPCILALAMLSWHFVEKPALRRKPGAKTLAA